MATIDMLRNIQGIVDIQPSDSYTTSIIKFITGTVAKTTLMATANIEANTEHMILGLGSHFIKGQEKNLTACAKKAAEVALQAKQSLDSPFADQTRQVEEKGYFVTTKKKEVIESPKISDYVKKTTSDVKNVAKRHKKNTVKLVALVAFGIIFYKIASNLPATDFDSNSLGSISLEQGNNKRSWYVAFSFFGICGLMASCLTISEISRPYVISRMSRSQIQAYVTWLWEDYRQGNMAANGIDDALPFLDISKAQFFCYIREGNGIVIDSSSRTGILSGDDEQKLINMWKERECNNKDTVNCWNVCYGKKPIALSELFEIIEKYPPGPHILLEMNPKIKQDLYSGWLQCNSSFEDFVNNWNNQNPWEIKKEDAAPIIRNYHYQFMKPTDKSYAAILPYELEINIAFSKEHPDRIVENHNNSFRDMPITAQDVVEIRKFTYNYLDSVICNFWLNWRNKKGNENSFSIEKATESFNNLYRGKMKLSSEEFAEGIIFDSDAESSYPERCFEGWKKHLGWMKDKGINTLEKQCNIWNMKDGKHPLTLKWIKGWEAGKDICFSLNPRQSLWAREEGAGRLFQGVLQIKFSPPHNLSLSSS